MPFVQIHIVKGRSLETRRKLAEAITLAVSDILDLEPAATHVVIQEHERDSWAIGGELLSERQTAEVTVLPDLEAVFGKPKTAGEPLAASAPAQKSRAKSRSAR